MCKASRVTISPSRTTARERGATRTISGWRTVYSRPSEVRTANGWKPPPEMRWRIRSRFMPETYRRNYAWSTAAIYYSNLPANWLRILAAAAFALGALVLFLRARPRLIAPLVLAGAFGAVVVWFLVTPPSNHRDWQPDVAVLPWAGITGGIAAIHNIRNCDYRTETD